MGLAIISYCYSIGDERLKNFALILNCGSIIIGIFYSLINYEHNQLKLKHDVQSAKETLTFNTACKMHDEKMIMHFKKVRNFYIENKTLFDQSKMDEIDKRITPDENWISFIIVFNYLESIAIGINQYIMDEDFIKEFFKSLYLELYYNYGTFIVHLRKERGVQDIFKGFTDLAINWESSKK
mgnify:FL=1